MTSGRKRGFTVLLAALTASAVLGALSAPALAQPSAESSEALTARALASPRTAIQRVSDPSALRAKSRIGQGNWCDGQAGGACWLFLDSGTSSAPNTCLLGGGNGSVITDAGFFIADDGSYPAVGDTYWGIIDVGVSVVACSALLANVDTILPKNVSFALDPTLANDYGRIRCDRYKYSGNSVVQHSVFTGRSGTDSDTNGPYECYDQPSQSSFGSALGYVPMLATLSTFQITNFAFPIKSTKPSTVAPNSTMRSRAQITSNRTDDVFMEHGILVRESNLSVGARRIGASIRATGVLKPASEVRSVLTQNRWIPGVMVKLLGRKRGKMRQLASKPVVLAKSGAFVANFARVKRASRCQIVASYGGVKTARRNVTC